MITAAQSCQCCGAPYGETGDTQWANGQVRCRRHYGRNPCAIEGCTRTTSADGYYADNDWLCGEHWRRFVPPRSKYRRHYHALHRRGKRLDWPMPLRRQYWRYWTMLVRRARRLAAEGTLDVNEINRVMGW